MEEHQKRITITPLERQRYLLEYDVRYTATSGWSRVRAEDGDFVCEVKNSRPWWFPF